MIVQIYEIQTPKEAEVMLGLGVDHIGSVVTSAEDWKDEQLRQTIRLVKQSGACSSLIPLTQDWELTKKIIDYYQPDIIHFCDGLNLAGKPGVENALELQTDIKNRYPELQVMRSIPVPPTGISDGDECLGLARFFESTSDWLLIDTLLVGFDDSAADQPVEGFIGITGQPCDWQIASRIVKSLNIPVILAGGLGPQNVAQAVSQVKPAGVDSCTGTNANNADGEPIRFKKDPEKVRRFVETARKV